MLDWWQPGFTLPRGSAAWTVEMKHAGDDEALAVADASQREIDIWREYNAWYGYAFLVVRG